MEIDLNLNPTSSNGIVYNGQGGCKEILHRPAHLSTRPPFCHFRNALPTCGKFTLAHASNLRGYRDETDENMASEGVFVEEENAEKLVGQNDLRKLKDLHFTVCQLKVLHDIVNGHFLGIISYVFGILNTATRRRLLDWSLERKT